jgi:hypothetical protein
MPPFPRFQCEDRQERHRDSEQREEQRRADLARRFDQNLQARLALQGAGSSSVAAGRGDRQQGNNQPATSGARR